MSEIISVIKNNIGKQVVITYNCVGLGISAKKEGSLSFLPNGIEGENGAPMIELDMDFAKLVPVGNISEIKDAKTNEVLYSEEKVK